MVGRLPAEQIVPDEGDNRIVNSFDEHEEALRSIVRVTDASTAYAENNNYYISCYIIL